MSLLMDHWLQLGGPHGLRRSWTAIKSDHARHGPSRELTDRIQTLVNKAGVSFYFHMLSLVASRGLAANRQLFYLTMVFRHKGLSRTGLSLLSAMNLGLSPLSFDSKLVDHAYRCEAHRRSVAR